MEEEKIEKAKINFFKKKEIWISGIVGLVIGGALIYLLGILGLPGLGHKTIATFKGGKITENEVYKEMEKYDISSYKLQIAEDKILEKKYKLTEDQKKEVSENVEKVLNTYKEYYGISEEDAIEKSGFKSKDELIKYFESDYRKNLCTLDYLKTIISEEDIENYYNENDIYGKISTKHILVQTSEDITDKEALATAKEIIEKLKSGKSFDDVANEYNGKAKVENVDFDSFSEAELEENYVKSSKGLEKDSYTTEPVKTSFGYHVIYCVNKEDKPSLENVKDDILEKLGNELDSTGTGYITYQALINLGKEFNLKFKEKDMQENYENYSKQISSYSSTSSELEE